MAVKWWESKRLIFNLLVGASGIYGIYVGLSEWTESIFHAYDLIGIILWGVFANILFSTGILVEIADQYYFTGNLKLYRFRWAFLITGVLLYCFVTWFVAWIHYTSFMFF